MTERPETYELIQNVDKTVTLKKVEGEIIQQGTPISAKNLNNIETGIYGLYLKVETLFEKFATLNVEVATLKNASLNNLNNNIFFEDFKDLSSINLKSGVFDSINKRLVI